jgi:hypothetical protein
VLALHSASSTPSGPPSKATSPPRPLRVLAMLSPTQGLLRGLRAGSLGVLGFVLALVAHLAAGGAAPGPVVLLLLAWLTGLAAVLLTGARLSPVRIGVSLSAMQLVLHEVFMWLGAQTGCAMTAVSAPAGGLMDHGARPVALPVCATAMAHTGMGQHSMFAATAMVGAHVGATAVTAALLAYGEKVLWFLAGWVRLPCWLHVGLPELPGVRVVFLGAPPRCRVRFANGGVGRRGPPPWGLLAVG